MTKLYLKTSQAIKINSTEICFAILFCSLFLIISLRLVRWLLVLGKIKHSKLLSLGNLFFVFLTLNIFNEFVHVYNFIFIVYLLFRLFCFLVRCNLNVQQFITFIPRLLSFRFTFFRLFLLSCINLLVLFLWLLVDLKCLHFGLKLSFLLLLTNGLNLILRIFGLLGTLWFFYFVLVSCQIDLCCRNASG